jgi:regulator of sigma E protease
MISTILLVFFSLIGLITLHELGHFLLAKKFGVRVEEFGMFLPPRIWGKKFGETVYSINWIPAGAFVRLYGEDREDEENGKKENNAAAAGRDAAKDPRSFGSKPIWQRMLIIAAGVISFWLISVIILTYVSFVGAVEAIDDSDPVPGAQVQIVAVADNSPAKTAGLQTSDIVTKMALAADAAQAVQVDKVAQIQDFASSHKGQEVLVDIQRGSQSLQVSLTPRVDPPAGEGVIGIALMRTAKRSYPGWQAVGNGFAATWNMTTGVFEGWGEMIGRLVRKEGLPPGTQLVGPVGIMGLMTKQAQMGINYYLQFVAMISVYLAVFNALPIPALDGGRLMFLAIEAVMRRPVPVKIEQSLTMFFFMALMLFAVIITVQDVRRLF